MKKNNRCNHHNDYAQAYSPSQLLVNNHQAQDNNRSNDNSRTRMAVRMVPRATPELDPEYEPEEPYHPSYMNYDEPDNDEDRELELCTQGSSLYVSRVSMVCGEFHTGSCLRCLQRSYQRITQRNKVKL